MKLKIYFGLPFIILMASNAAAAPFYTAQELPFPSGWTYVSPAAINDSNHVVGNTSPNRDARQIYGYGIYWPTTTLGIILDAQTNGTVFSYSQTAAINNNGVIAGAARESNHIKQAGYWQAGVWQSYISLISASSPATILVESYASGVNNNNAIAITQQLQSSGTSPQNYNNIAFYNPTGQILGYTSSVLSASNRLFSTSIDNQNIIVGNDNNSGIQATPTNQINGPLITTAVPAAIYIQDKQGSTLVGLSKTLSACYASNIPGGIFFADVADGVCQALAVNSTNKIVGTYTSSKNNFTDRAFIFEHPATVTCQSGFRDLNGYTVLPTTTTILTRANDINENGYIVAEGIDNGITKAYVLTPAANTADLPARLDTNNNGVIDACEGLNQTPGNNQFNVAALMAILQLLLN